MPGLTADRYSGILSVQITCLGMDLVKDIVYHALWDVLTEMGETVSGIYELNDIALRTLEGLPWQGLPPASAAKDASISLRQIEARQQAPDHPILWNVPETDYLKFYIFQVV
jgi:23S rRNA G2069 N7-methylase RlmK/C1962 C5-methylase RlmI